MNYNSNNDDITAAIISSRCQTANGRDGLGVHQVLQLFPSDPRRKPGARRSFADVKISFTEELLDYRPRDRAQVFRIFGN